MKIVFLHLYFSYRMFLNQIKLTNFKNYEDSEFDFSEKVNAIVGENGSGKTNLLDAIHYLSFCKSYFTSHDSLSIQFEKDFFAIHGEFIDFEDRRSTKVGCTFKSPGRKVMKANQKEYNLLSDHIGLFPVIMISPYDHDIINEGSEMRRRFFDMIISQFDKEYLQQLIKYQKLIVQRNSLLKKFIEERSFDRSLLKIFDDQLIEPGNLIFQRRRDYIEEFIPYFQKYYASLSEGKENVNIIYESGVSQQPIEEGFRNHEMADRKSGYTNFGIHKDDYLFTINERPVKRFGSQGQQKSYSIALKLSQFDYTRLQKRMKPILLLDDIFDKLDMNRISRLLELVGKDDVGQVFISDTNMSRVKEILEKNNIVCKMFTIERK